MFARRSEPDLKMPNGTSGSRLRDSITAKAARPATTRANEPSVRADAQPACCAETTVYTSRSMAAVTVSAPGRSKGRRRVVSCGASRGISSQPAASTISATGAGTSRVHRQLTWVSRPDSTRPRENPLPPKTEYRLNARLRIGPSGNVVVSGAAAEQQQPAVAEDVAADDPLQR